MTLEAFLARLYGSEREVSLFLEAREAYARSVGLPQELHADVLAMDAESLKFAAWSYACKRGHRGAEGATGDSWGSGGIP